METSSPPFERLDTLVGREAEVQLLQDAYHHVLDSPRCCEAILVHGESGTGKTALVQHCFQRQLADGTMVSAKFDIINVAARPYSSIVDVLTQLCQEATWNYVSNEEELRIVTSKMLSIGDLKILSTLVPAVERRLTNLILSTDTDENCDSSSEQPSIDGTLACARLTEIVRSFLYVVTQFLPSPLILFLDDVDRADTESLYLISSLTSMHSESCNLLLILAYSDRADETQQMKKRSIIATARAREIQLRNLDAHDVNEMVSKLLRKDPKETTALSQVVTERTGGNIYFGLQFLDMLKNERLLVYNFEYFQWEWDVKKVHANTNVTDNVAPLLTSKIQHMSSDVQLALRLAAFLGFYFDVEFIKRVAMKEGAAICNASNDLLLGKPRKYSNSTITDETSLLPSREMLQSFDEAIKAALDEHLIDQVVGTKYKFTHDRVLQAVYEMTPPGREREALHWRIGQELWPELHHTRQRGATKISDDWLLFAAADQLNRGSDCALIMPDIRSRIDLARLNLDAGKAALAKSAVKHAAGFLDRGVRLMNGRWQSEYSMCLELHTLAAQTEYAASSFEKCDQRISEVLVHGRCLNDKLPAYLVKVQSHGIRGNVLEAVDESVRVLQLLGNPIPRRPNLVQLLLEIAKTKRLLKKVKIADFVSLPNMTSQPWGFMFLQNISLYGYYAGQKAAVVVSVCRMVRLTVKHGVSSQGPSVLASYGVVLGFLGELEAAYEVGRVALELTNRPHTSVCHARTIATVYSLLNHLKQPITQTLDHCMNGYHAGMKFGEMEGAALCLSVYASLGTFLGKNLNIVLAEMEGFRQAYRDEMSRNFTMMCLLPHHEFALNMLGRSNNPLSLSGDIMCEESFLVEVERTGNQFARSSLIIVRMILQYVFCEFEAASEEVVLLNMATNARGTQFATPFVLMYSALTMLAMARATRRRWYSRKANTFVRIMHKFAKAGNLNLPPLLKLVAAEQKSLRRQSSSEEVKKAYESAVGMASQSGFSVVAAVGNERAGEYMLSIGDTFWAETYLSRAFLLYDEWGAVTKTQQMMKQHLFLAESENLSSGGCRNINMTMRKRYNFRESSERREMSVPQL